MNKIGIVGTRRRNEIEDFRAVLNKFKEIYQKGDMIISGGCKKGGDIFAEVISKKFKIPIMIFEAEWKRYKLGAGKKRNTYIARFSDYLIACVAEDRTGGAEDTITKFLAFNYERNLFLV